MAEPKFRPDRRRPARARQRDKAIRLRASRRNLAFSPVGIGQQPEAWRVERVGGLGTAMACNDHACVMTIPGRAVPIYQVGSYEEADLYCWVCDVKLLWIEQSLLARPHRAA